MQSAGLAALAMVAPQKFLNIAIYNEDVQELPRHSAESCCGPCSARNGRAGTAGKIRSTRASRDKSGAVVTLCGCGVCHVMCAAMK